MPARAKPTHAELLDLAIRRAPAARAAGLLSIEVVADGATVRAALAPADPTPPDDSDAADDVISDPLNDPATYPGGRIPRSRFRHDDDTD